jgi:hypothetical protein
MTVAHVFDVGSDMKQEVEDDIPRESMMEDETVETEDDSSIDDENWGTTSPRPAVVSHALDKHASGKKPVYMFSFALII